METNQNQIDSLCSRLDALIRITLETNKNKDKPLTDGESVRILKSCGLAPTDIAKILGKKSATDIAPYLYPKTNKKQVKTKSNPSLIGQIFGK